jgi:hypothetical protein
MSNQYLWNRIAAPNPDIRASDADRERVAERLRKGHAEGRLDLAEFQQRLEHCYEARTLGELHELVSDLPRQAEPDERRPLQSFRPWHWSLARLAPILFALIVISAATAHHHVFLLWIPLVFLFWRLSWSRRRAWTAGARRGPDELL